MKSAPLLAAVGVVLGAIWWGGGTSHAAQAATLGAIGLVFVAAPARTWPTRTFSWLALAWLVLASAAFLPAAWFGSPAWRVRVVEAGIVLPPTLTPQPWLTLDALAWLGAGLAWLGWLGAWQLDSATRRMTMRTLAVGLTLIAAVALIAWMMHTRLPGWL